MIGKKDIIKIYFSSLGIINEISVSVVDTVEIKFIILYFCEMIYEIYYADYFV